MGLYIDKIKSQKDIKEEVERLSKRDSKILDKYKKLINRSNYYRVEKNKEIVDKNKERLELKLPKIPLLPLKTEVSIKTAVTFFTSIQLGHFRNDIVTNYYCTFEEAIKNPAVIHFFGKYKPWMLGYGHFCPKQEDYLRYHKLTLYKKENYSLESRD